MCTFLFFTVASIIRELRRISSPCFVRLRLAILLSLLSVAGRKSLRGKSPFHPFASYELEQLLLFSLVALGDEAYGVSVRELIESETGRAPSPGAIYTGYERLERRGLVESYMGEPTRVRGGRPKRYYVLTAKGARALKDSYQRVVRLANRSRLQRLEQIARGVAE